MIFFLVFSGMELTPRNAIDTVVLCIPSLSAIACCVTLAITRFSRFDLVFEFSLYKYDYTG